MRQSRTAFVVLMGALAGTTGAQSVRDSGGVQVVTNSRPALTGGQALRLSARPTLVIGDRPGDPYLLSRVAGAVRLDNGRVVVADGASLELRIFDSSGAFVRAAGGRGGGPGEFRSITSVARFPGDTLAVHSSPSTVTLLTATGTFVRVHGAANPPLPLGAGIKLVLAAFPGGARVFGTITSPAARHVGDRWVDSVPLVVVNRDNVELRNLGVFPSMDMVMEKEHPRPPWFGAALVYANDARTFYTGFGGSYEIRAWSAAGRLERIIRRDWVPRGISVDDIEQFNVEWGKRWIRSTGAAAEAERRDLRDDPYAATLPAFSQFIADRVGRLWVREAHVADAAWAGSLATLPVVPSVWSVFDPAGRWLSDVTMPARFLPKEIGRDYVLGVARDGDDVETVVQYALSGGRP